MGRTGTNFKSSKNSTISAQSYRNAHCRTSVGFGDSHRLSTAGGYFPDDKSATLNDMGEYTSQYPQTNT